MKPTAKQVEAVALELFLAVVWGPSPVHKKWCAMDESDRAHWFRHARAAIKEWERVRPATKRRKGAKR